MEETTMNIIPKNRSIILAPGKLDQPRLTGQKLPLQPKHVWAIRTRLQLAGKNRDLALFNVGIDSKLRGCDVVRLKKAEVMPNGHCVDRVTIRQKKTGRPVSFELTEHAQSAIKGYLSDLPADPNPFLFPGQGKTGFLTPRHYARLVRDWILSIGLDATLYGTHSLRRTKAALIYRRTGNLRAVQLLLGHAKIESTVRYLGVEVDDALELARQVDV